MSIPTQVRAEARGHPASATVGGVWEDFSALEQDLLLAAFAENVLWVPCAGNAERSGTASDTALREAAGRMVGLGLMWFYRVADGYPDLTVAEVEQVCADEAMWDVTHDGCHRVGLYLTDAGEETLPIRPDSWVRPPTR